MKPVHLRDILLITSFFTSEFTRGFWGYWTLIKCLKIPKPPYFLTTSSQLLQAREFHEVISAYCVYLDLSVCLSACVSVCLLFPSHFTLVSFWIIVLILWMMSWSHICGALRDLVQPGCFSHFLNCASDTKSRKASHIIQPDRARLFVNFGNGSSIPSYANPWRPSLSLCKMFHGSFALILALEFEIQAF